VPGVWPGHAGLARDVIAGMISRNARQWQDVLAGPGDKARRPSPGTWSALGYACHVRDVLRLCDERLVLMLATGGPRYPNWDQDVCGAGSCPGGC